MNLHSRYASAEHDFNKQCRLFQRIYPKLFTDLGICDIIKTRNEGRKQIKLKGVKIMKNNIQKDGIATTDTQQPIGLILKNQSLFLIQV